MHVQTLTAQPVESLLQLLNRSGHLDLQHRLVSEADHTPELRFELFGPDIALLTARNGELLLAIEHIAAKLLRLEPEEHDRISFDADSFKADRNRQLHSDAQAAIAQVKLTGRPHSFPPMTSRERRMLHLILEPYGLPTASSGENPRRFVVLYPKNYQPQALVSSVAPTSTVIPERTHNIRNAFRRR